MRQQFDSAFQLDEIVYHRISNEKGMVSAIQFCATGAVVYYVSWGHDCCVSHSASELSSEPCPEWQATD